MDAIDFLGFGNCGAGKWVIQLAAERVHRTWIDYAFRVRVLRPRAPLPPFQICTRLESVNRARCFVRLLT